MIWSLILTLIIIYYFIKYPPVHIEKIPVLIVGGGPSGASTALTLNAIQIKNIIIEKKSEDDPTSKVGDCLHSNAKPILSSLDVLSAIESQNYVRSNGGTSAWGTSKLSFNDSIFNPYGTGWHLDRCLFDRTLRDTAKTNGTVVYYDHSFVDIKKRKNQWIVEVSCGSKKKFFECDWIVDASGRLSKVATSIGYKRETYDDLLAFIVVYVSDIEDKSTFSLVQSVENGWFYTAPLSKKERVVMFHTDDGLPIAKQAKTLVGFQEILESAEHVQELIKKYNYEPKSERPQCVSAKSQKLNSYGSWEEKWIAVGDSAMSYDPLSSQGIMLGLMSGVAASNTIARCREAESEDEKKYHMEYYGAGCNKIYSNYLDMKKKFYQMEKRFNDSDFWKKYQSIKTTL